MSTRRLLAGIAALFVMVAVAGACSGTDEAATTPSTDASDTTTTTAPAPSGVPVTSAPRQTCDAANLALAAGAALPGAAFVDVVCQPTHAVATWESSPDGAIVALFALQDGVWAMVASGSAEGDVTPLVPADFSPTAVPDWQRLRAARLAREANPESGGGATGGVGGGTPTETIYYVDPETGAVESCVSNGETLDCKPAPGIPPTSVDPSSPPVTSVFCRFNYNDPRCQADGGFEP